jgi:hypothetical protein
MRMCFAAMHESTHGAFRTQRDVNAPRGRLSWRPLSFSDHKGTAPAVLSAEAVFLDAVGRLWHRTLIDHIPPSGAVRF